MKLLINTIASSLLVLGALPALAQNPNLIETYPAVPTKISGSDTLNKVMDDLITALAASGELSGGIDRYIGCGSSCGERQVEGSPRAGDGDVNVCTPNDGNGSPELNPGCQEIAPMSRQLGFAICDDDPNFPLTINNQAEGLGFCGDGTVITAHNDSLGAFGESAAACAAFHALPDTANTGNTYPDRGVGRLRASGTLPTTGYVLNGWRDVLRLVYTGCRNTEGACANLNNRVERCNSDVRKEVVANWANLFEGVACPQSGGCPTGLRHAYRRDDSSGTTGVFLEVIQVANNVKTNLLSRAAMVNTVPPSIVLVPNFQAFCDGGHIEGLIPTHLGPATPQFPSGEPLYTNGDPIRTNCAPEDDLCGPDGKLGLVRPIRSTDNILGNIYPTHQCRRSFEYRQFINTALPICPDRTKPSAGRCKLPFYEVGGFKTFNCLTSARQADSKAVAGTDGRVYNYVMREQDGTVSFEAVRLPLTASWRQNMAKLDNGPLAQGKEFQGSDFVCIQEDATRNIGCLTANSKCTIGFAGRESAFNNSQPSVHLTNEPAKLNNLPPSNANIASDAYPFSRLLYVNASRGFENIMEDCKNRGGSRDFCEDQRRIALEFYNAGQPGNVVGQICSNAGFIPLDAPVCRGAQGSTGSAPCGAPAVQALAACAPDSRSYGGSVASCPTHPLVTPGPAGSNWCFVANTTLAAPMTVPLTMSPSNQWLLEGQLIVGTGTADGATTLTVMPGTTVQGTKTNSVIVIQRFSKIMAEGTAAAPIVFTSHKPIGQRGARDWGGIIINGNAPTNNPVAGDAVSEGVLALYGGNNAADNSGVLKYVRIEFAGGKISDYNEFNGLSIQGVGTGTVIDYVQTHMTQDDGIEFFGGTVNAKHLVSTGANDDCFDWTDGWSGKVQYVYLRKLANSGNQSSDPRGIEADNRNADPNRLPRSLPILSNFTIINDRVDALEGARFRRGTGAKMWNFVIKGFPTCLYLDSQAAANIASGDLSVQNFVLNCPTALAQDMGDTSASALFTGKNVIMSDAALGPEGVPAAGSPALTAGANTMVPADPFFDQVSYAGAFDGTSNWMDGWTTAAAN